MGEIRGHAGTAECRGALRLARNPSTPGSQPLCLRAEVRASGFSAPRFPAPRRSGRLSGGRAALRPPLPSAAFPPLSGSLRACWGGHRAAQPPSRVRGTGGPSLPAPGGPLQRQAAWRRGGAGAGPGCQQPGPPHPGPVQLERLSLALQIHARPGAATPKRRRCRARPGQQTLAPWPDSALPPL